MWVNTFAVCVDNGRKDEVMKFTHEVHQCPISSDRSELGGIIVGMKLVSMIAEWK